jgi:hypothetical protein
VSHSGAWPSDASSGGQPGARFSDYDDDATAHLDARTLEILEHRRGTAKNRRRGWLVRRALAIADLAGLTLAFTMV